MRLTVVGSGTAAPEADRVCSGYWLHASDSTLLLDCGPGVCHHLARLGLDWPRLDHVVVTHFHNDHIGDLPMLLFALKWGVAEGRKTPLTIWAPHGIQERLRAMAAAFGDHVVEPGFPLVVREVAPGDVAPIAGLDVRVEKTLHTDESVAYRLEGAAAVGYTGDTGPSEELQDFFHGVDLLVAECSLPDDEGIPTHLTPSSLAALATGAAPARLVPTHVYPQLSRRDLPRLLREAGWEGETVRAWDGLELDVGDQPRP